MTSTAQRVSVELPWPAKPLHPNARSHFMAKARAAKKARTEAGTVAKPKVRGMAAERLKVTITFRPPSNRGDTDNMLSACKAYLDGIADATGINDRCFEIEKPIRGDPVKGGLVIVELEAA